MKSADRPSTPNAISHHSPSRSIGPIIPGVCRLSSQVCTAGGCATALTSSRLRNTRPVLGRSAVAPTYRAPICSRTTLRAPSAPTTYSAVTGTATPAGSSRVAWTGPSVTAVTVARAVPVTRPGRVQALQPPAQPQVHRRKLGRDLAQHLFEHVLRHLLAAFG